MNLPPPPPPRAPVGFRPAGTLTCYRHPNREAGRRCTRCGKPACAECLVQASVGSHCLDCARIARPDTKTRARYWNARQTTLVTYALILTNVLVFIYVLIDTPDSVMGDTNATGYLKLGLITRSPAQRLPDRHPRRPARPVVPAGVVGVPALRHPPPGVQHVRLVGARADARADAGPAAVRHGLLRVPAGRQRRRPAVAAERAARRRLRRRVRLVRADHRGLPPARHQPVDDVARRRSDRQRAAVVPAAASPSAATSAAPWPA